jgi:hypothetical protein
MPAGFDRCISAGGRVRTKKLSGGKYMRICFLRGKSYAGEVKTVKTTKGGRIKKIALFKKKE